MNNEQLESCLRQWNRNSDEPVTINTLLEEKMMQEMNLVQARRKRLRRICLQVGALFLGVTVFLVAGGDAAVVNYVSPSTTVDDQGNPVPQYESIWTSFLHHVHEHLRQLHGKHAEQ